MDAELQYPVPEAEAARVRLAARPNTCAGTLRTLATDEAVMVRATVALNPAHAPEADRRLLADPDERVRALLAKRLTTMLPSLDLRGQREAQEHVHAMLLALADDAATRVRAAISDAVQGMPEAPRAVILRLAADPVPAVSDPVLRLSPLLTDDDLLELLATPPFPEAVCTVAARPGLSGVVADHIARHADSPAVRTLLENRSAAIRESTLDGLVGRAAGFPEWHYPLARRPTLSLRAVRSLSRFVAAQVLDVLAARPELPAAMVDEVRNRTSAALDETGADLTEADPVDHVRRLADAGGLNETSLLAALAAGDHRLACTMLAAASDTSPVTVERAVALRSGKALISLAWKAGFSMQAAVQIQTVLGQLGTPEVVQPPVANDFPLGDDEMEWQVELLATPGQ